MSSKKILVIGNNGSVKTFFSKKLGKRLGLPVIHLDEHFHREDGSRLGKKEWDEKLDSLLERPKWIMDGTYPRTLESRVKFCDTIVFIDLPKWLCFYRATLRTIKFKINKSSVSKQARIKGYLRLLRKMIFFSRNKILRTLLKNKDGDVVVLRSNDEISQYVNS